MLYAVATCTVTPKSVFGVSTYCSSRLHACALINAELGDMRMQSRGRDTGGLCNGLLVNLTWVNKPQLTSLCGSVTVH